MNETYWVESMPIIAAAILTIYDWAVSKEKRVVPIVLLILTICIPIIPVFHWPERYSLLFISFLVVWIFALVLPKSKKRVPHLLRLILNAVLLYGIIDSGINASYTTLFYSMDSTLSRNVVAIVKILIFVGLAFYIYQRKRKLAKADKN